MKKLIKIFDYALNALLLLMISICLITIYNYKKTGVSSFYGYTIVQVVSPSMTASDILVGDVQLISKSDSYKIGDIIAYKYHDIIIFHEIIDIDTNSDFITKGSSNNVKDSCPVKYDQIIGKRIIKTKLNFLANKDFKISIILSIYIIMMFSYINDIRKELFYSKIQMIHENKKEKV